MKDNQIILPHNINAHSLSKINGISFTQREITIMACLLNGRATKKIASLLSISSRTVETHIRNIMQKIDCNSREGILDFIESSGLSTLFRQTYESLCLQISFEKTLLEISKLKGEIKEAHLIIYGEDGDLKKYLNLHLKEDLKQAGVQAHIHLDSCDTQFDSQDLVILLQLDQTIPAELSQFRTIDLRDKDNYYYVVFSILEWTYPNIDLEKSFLNFKKVYEGVESCSESIDPHIRQTSKEKHKDISHVPILNSKKKIFAYVLSLCFIVAVASFVWQLTRNSSSSSVIRSDLIIPNEKVLLTRQEALKEIGKKLNNQKDIQSIVLIGPGGSGKTTLARQYARVQNAPIVWEVNAESRDKIRTSFENLAYLISKSDEDRRRLAQIIETKDPVKKEEQILQFIKDKFVKNPGWVLIFDNIEKFSDSQYYYPSDLKAWGKGKVILTTRDQHYKNNNQIGHSLILNDLTHEEKYDLFTKILNNTANKNIFGDAKTDINEFIKKLPPYPLDVSVAAYFLTEAQMPYKDYLDHLHTNASDFHQTQKHVLANITTYSKTRHNIIITSVNKLSETNKDFTDLLLFISLIDSENIPRELLSFFKNETQVYNFILKLKKYSLLVDNLSHNSLNIHRNTQETCRNYLLNSISIEQKEKIISDLILAFEAYFEDLINNEKFTQMKQLESHIQALKLNKEVLPPSALGALTSELGCIYYFSDQYEPALAHLNESLNYLTENTELNNIRRARTLSHMGKVYRDKSEYKESEKYFRLAQNLYENSSVTNPIELARTYAYLGSVCSEQEKFEEGRNFLNQSLKINQENGGSDLSIAWILLHLAFIDRQIGDYDQARIKYYDSLKIYRSEANKLRTYRVMGSLGKIYYKLGEYEKAKDIIEEGLEHYKKDFSDSDINVAGLMMHVGNAYLRLNDFKKAKESLTKSLEIHDKLLGKENVRTLGVLGALGNVLSESGQHQQGIEYQQIALSAYQKKHGNDHIETIELLTNLGRAYALANDFENAEKAYKESLLIYEKKNHPDAFIIYENLGELYKLKADHALKNGNVEVSNKYVQQSKDYLQESLRLLSARYPKDSPHITRVKDKLER